MKAVLISIRPEWCAKIATGEKTIEVRKTAPKLPTPYKCYLYCTLSGCNEFFRDVLHGDAATWNRENWGLRKGNVWAECICDMDIPLLFSCTDPAALVTNYEVQGTCLSDVEIMNYLGNGKAGHGLHFSDLKIYDEPKPLHDFTGLCKTKFGYAPYALTRPPQSWCYVEEIHE